ncbi:MAG: phosphoribosylanthranilate isomerase [bacterium]
MLSIPKIKICGITNLNDARNALELGADVLGLIFYEKSARFVSPEAAKPIIEELRKTEKKQLKNFLSVKRNVIIAGVFVNENPEKIKNTVKDLGIDIVQLSGTESLEYVEDLDIARNLVLKAVHLKEDADLEKIYYYKEAGVNVLLDAFGGKDAYGGTGAAINLNMLKNINMNDLILAGGIGPGNIEYILKSVKPYGIDLSSKIEDLPGKKNSAKMALFFKNLKGASYEIA